MHSVLNPDDHLKTPFTDFTTSRKMTLKCEPSQYGAFLVSLQAQSMTVLSFSGLKRSGEMLGALALWAPSQKGWERQGLACEDTDKNHINQNYSQLLKAYLFSEMLLWDWSVKSRKTTQKQLIKLAPKKISMWTSGCVPILQSCLKHRDIK